MPKQNRASIKIVLNLEKEKTSKQICSEVLKKEAQIGFEPMIRVLQTHALPLGYCAIYILYSYNSFIIPVKCKSVNLKNI